MTERDSIKDFNFASMCQKSDAPPAIVDELIEIGMHWITRCRSAEERLKGMEEALKGCVSALKPFAAMATGPGSALLDDVVGGCGVTVDWLHVKWTARAYEAARESLNPKE